MFAREPRHLLIYLLYLISVFCESVLGLLMFQNINKLGFSCVYLLYVTMFYQSDFVQKNVCLSAKIRS